MGWGPVRVRRKQDPLGQWHRPKDRPADRPLCIRVAWEHYSVNLEAKHTAHLPVLLYCTGEEPVLVNQIHWHESYTPHTIPYCSYA